MKKIFGMFLWLAITIALTGCIVNFTPKDKFIVLESGDSKTFKAVSDNPTARLVWYLDEVQVANGQVYAHTFTNTSDMAVKPTLTVREEGGKLVQYYKMAGIAEGYMSSVTWMIKVLPVGCAEGKTREITCGDGACKITIIETCINGEFTGDACVPGTPSDEVCDGIDNNCNGAIDEGIEEVATTCGVGACTSMVTSTCVGGRLVDSCVEGTPTAEVCDNIDNDCNGAVDDDIASTPTTCGTGACASTGINSCVNGAMNDSCVAGTPRPIEICDNSIDDNCDGLTDGQDTVCRPPDYVPQT